MAVRRHSLGECVDGTLEALARNAGTSEFTLRTGTLYTSARIFEDENLLLRVGVRAVTDGGAGVSEMSSDRSEASGEGNSSEPATSMAPLRRWGACNG
jgi:hypothetical protein